MSGDTMRTLCATRSRAYWRALRGRDARRGETGVGPMRCVGVSTSDFWKLFDALPRTERDFLNYATNGPDFRNRYQQVLQRNRDLLVWP